MSLLLLADPGTLWTRTVEPWVGGVSSYPLGNNFNFPNELWGQGIFTENFPNPSRSRTGEAWVVGPSSYPLGHEVVVERIISELPDIMRWRNHKSKSLPGVEREWPFKNNYKFFGGNLVLQHVHPPTRTSYLVASILNPAPSLPQSFLA